MTELGPKTSPTGQMILENEEYAFGVFMGKDFDCKYLEHSGGWAGYRSYFMRFLEEGLTIAVLGNHEAFEAEEYAIKIAEIILGKKAKK